MEIFIFLGKLEDYILNILALYLKLLTIIL